jgi:hypothetical protein
MFSLYDELRRRQQMLHLVVPQESQLTRVLSITGLSRAVPTHATLDEALQRAR